jgi:hypothetical protein
MAPLGSALLASGVRRQSRRNAVASARRFRARLRRPQAQCTDGGCHRPYAIWKKQAAAVRLLLSAGADVDTQDDNGKSALMAAVDTPEIAAMLLEKGARTDVKDHSEWTALMYANKNADMETIRLLHRKTQDR